MSDINWTEIIKFVFQLIADGIPKQDAISKASSKFGISKSDISGKI